MGRSCIVCFCNKSKNPELSFHDFPKDINQRAKWLHSLRLTEESLTKSSKVCSKHFKDEDLKGAIGKVSLQPNAIPTRKRKKTSSNINKIVASTSTTTTNQHEPIFMQINSSNTSFQQTQPDPLTSIHPENNQSQPDILTSTSAHELSNISSGQSEGSCEAEPILLYVEIPSECSENTPPISETEVDESCNRRKFSYRYIGDLSPEDFSSPSRANWHINLIKKQFKESKSLIKNLKQKNKRLSNRVNVLKDLVKQLKKTKKNGFVDESIRDLSTDLSSDS